MSTQQEKTDQDLGFEKAVVKYLREHPDFFERHMDLLADMILPHESGKAVSLVERQVSVLREQKDSQRHKLQQLLKNAQANERISDRINHLILALLDAANLDEVLDIVQSRLSTDFEADTVVVKLFDTGHPALKHRPEIVDWSEPVLGAFEKVIRERRPVCGRLKHGQLESLFSDEAGQIASAALIPLVENENSKTCYGMVAIGSHNPERFHAEMGTLFLSHLGKVLTRVIKKRLAA
jgi:uncharacterized protein YigA (DUF484 family)